VYRYEGGKKDWFSKGLPVEIMTTELPKASDVVRRDAPSCHPSERLCEVRQEVHPTGWKQCVVLNRSGIVVGRLRREAWDAAPETLEEDVMECGATTFRPHTLLTPLIKRMQERKVANVVITTSNGALVGILFRADGEQYMSERQTSDQ
jgi:CBS domain-containing protein